uniref:Permease of the major facilitator superfamily protein n=1 Tax=Lutzomyia longipalpis TaxID=7200 RepID=A0A1B0EX68_LUTLO
MTAILTLLTPVAAYHSVYMLLAVRIVEGVFEGVTFPCIHAIWARWAPVYERSRMATIAYAGNYAGTVGKTGFIAAIPYLVMGSLLGISGYLADWSQVKGYLTTSQVRKYFNCGAFLGQTVFMMLAAYLLDPTGTVASITVAVGLGAFAWSGFIVNPLDLAPNHASVILGFSNMIGTIPGIVSPFLTGVITKDRTKEQWQIVFFITSGIYCVGCVIYWFFSSGELQPWATSKEKSLTNLENPTTKNPKEGIKNEAMEMDE